MSEYISKLIIYFICLIISLYGLNALDFNRLLKKNKTKEAWILYLIIAIIFAYLLGDFIISITYYFHK